MIWQVNCSRWNRYICYSISNFNSSRNSTTISNSNTNCFSWVEVIKIIAFRSKFLSSNREFNSITNNINLTSSGVCNACIKCWCCTKSLNSQNAIIKVIQNSNIFRSKIGENCYCITNRNSRNIIYKNIFKYTNLRSCTTKRGHRLSKTNSFCGESNLMGIRQVCNCC